VEPETASNERRDQDLPIVKTLRAPKPRVILTDDDMSGCDGEQESNEKLASVNTENQLNVPKSDARTEKENKPRSRSEISSDQVHQSGGSQLSLGAGHRLNEVSKAKRPNAEDGNEGERSRCVTSVKLPHVSCDSPWISSAHPLYDAADLLRNRVLCRIRLRFHLL
jgi:hypothetical protein